MIRRVVTEGLATRLRRENVMVVSSGDGGLLAAQTVVVEIRDFTADIQADIQALSEGRPRCACSQSIPAA
jgi:precorrin-3B methylase